MSIVLLEAFSVLTISVILYALINGVARWKRDKQARSLLLVWIGLIGVLFALNPGSRLFTLPLSLVIAYVCWHYTKTKRLNRGEPATLLLQFCNYRSVALSGAFAGLMIVSLLYTWGFLQTEDFWQREGIGRAVSALANALIAGAALGVLRKYTRLKWPRSLLVPYTFSPDSNAVQTHEGEGFKVDELFMPLIVTPFLWLFLSEIHPGWSTIFLFGLMLPSFGFYLLWAFFHTAWLRWIGVVNSAERAVYDAYEVLIKDQSIQPWLGGVFIEFDSERGAYVVSGTLPGYQEKATIRRRLLEIEGARGVHDDAVRLDDELTPNPWYERAIERRRRQKSTSA